MNKKNTDGLKPKEKKSIEKLAERKVDGLISRELAKELVNVSRAVSRKIALLIDREGEILDVVVGSRSIVYLPDLGRFRLGAGRLRRVRLIFPELVEREPSIPHDIYTDLLKLRLDAVIGVSVVGNRVPFSLAHVDPTDTTKAVTITGSDLRELPQDFDSTLDLIEASLSGVRHTKSTRALLVGVSSTRERLEELSELARTAGVEVAGTVFQKRSPDPKTLLGKGKLEEVILTALSLDVDILIFDSELKPSQWRIITNATDLKVIDRSMLILDIFARRASSAEGRLQVELAQLKYNLPKLVEKDAGLSRLTGGIGGRGPGETKLEIGRRRIRDKIVELEKRIERISTQRDIRAKRRNVREVPLVSLVGYTNVGKSTLFNALTKANALVENKLFATLEPTKKRVVMPFDQRSELTEVVFSDTVGFIRELPDELFNAFRATIEEVHNSTLILHVVDASNKNWEEQYNSVRKLLEKVGAGEIPEILVFNKCDLNRNFEGNGIRVSALKKEGITDLLEEVAAKLFGNCKASYAK